MKRCLGLIFTMVGIALNAPMADAARGNDLVKVTELADVSAIQPGKPFMLGFKFSIEPKWHIYWKNPGDSGLATQVKLTLPEGFTAGELMFPVPERLQLPGDVINYAYENEVMLMVQVTPPNDLPIGKSVTIAAKVSFLVCSEVCIPGSQDVSLELPVDINAVAANSGEFDKWKAQLPLKEPPHDVASAGFDIRGDAGHRIVDERIIWRHPGKDMQFFPDVSDNGQVGEMKISTIGDMTMASFPVKDGTLPDQLSGVFTYLSETGTRIAFESKIPAVMSSGLDGIK